MALPRCAAAITGMGSRCSQRIASEQKYLKNRQIVPSNYRCLRSPRDPARLHSPGLSRPLLGLCAMATIRDQLQTYRSALTEAQTKGEQAIASKIEQQIRELEEFQQRHPEEAEAPSPFEVFCDLNPSDINCRVYDD